MSTTSDIMVRFVPLNREGIRRSSDRRASTPETAQAHAPDKQRAETALSWTKSQGLTSQLTHCDRLEVSLSPDQCQALFGVGMLEKDWPYGPYEIVQRPNKYLAPEKELPVPDALKDLVECAYIPRPVENYAASSFLPPTEDLYHLRLSNMILALNAAKCHRNGWTGGGVRAVMIDTGFAPHAHFERHGFSIRRVETPGSGDPANDPNGHGTGESANLLAIAPAVSFIGVKQGISAAANLETAIAETPDIISNSWGWNADHVSKDELKTIDANFFNELMDVETLLAEAVNSGITVLFSSGNGHRAFPASLPFVISVGGVTIQPDSSVEASTYASSFESSLFPGRRVPDISGIVGEANDTPPFKGHLMLPVPPGSELDGSNMPDVEGNLGWGIFSGTSAACPQVAGVVALMKSLNPNLTPELIKAALIANAVDITSGKTALGDEAEAGRDLATGAGLVDAHAACRAIVSIS